MDTLEIILQTAKEIGEEYGDWSGDLRDFTAMSSSVSQNLNSNDLKQFHKDFCGSSYLSEDTELYMYYSGRTPEIAVIRKEPKQKTCGKCEVCSCRTK